MKTLLTILLLVGCAGAQQVQQPTYFYMGPPPQQGTSDRPKFKFEEMLEHPRDYTLVEYVYLIALAAQYDIPLCSFAHDNRRCITVKEEAMDVPAINTGGICDTWLAPSPDSVAAKLGACYTCADKRRVLLTSEDGKKHCVLFPESQP